jgi:hypothetical protein
MKNTLLHTTGFFFRNTLILMGIFSLLIINTTKAESPQMGVSFQVFYDELLPYGDWIHDPVHGYVWVPYAESGFQPYASNGYWVMSTYGNTWVSNYDWGWAPFHYGRWYFDDYLGWAWVPGYEWGPAWVNWRTGGGYYGWAPLMPGLNIHVAINIPSHYYVFVPRRRLISRNIYNYYIPSRNIVRVYNQTTVINNTYVHNNRTYVSGPHRREIENVTRRSVPVYEVRNSNRPGRSSVGRNTLQVYQPNVRPANNSRNSTERPRRVVSAEDHRKNVLSRNNGGTTNYSRTAPTNSRTNTHTVRENTRRENSINSREASTTVNRSRSSENQGVVARENINRAEQVKTRNNPTLQRNQTNRVDNRVNTSPSRNVQTSKSQNSPNIRSRSEASNQVRARSQSTRSNNAVQNTRPNTQVQSREVTRSRNSPQVSNHTRQRSSGNVNRSSSNRSRAGRGNN